MLFNSYIFVLAFLPLTVIGYFILNHFQLYTWGLVYLTGMSLWFYGYFNPWYLIIILGSILVNFLLCTYIRKTRKKIEDKTSGECEKISKEGKKSFTGKGYMIVGVVLNLLLLFVFKYFDFFVTNVNAVFGTSWLLLHLVLPLGISFFTFQQISYVVDTYRGETDQYDSGIRGFVQYAAFVTFFPQLVAGPIVLHDELIPQLQNRSLKKMDFVNLSRGLYAFSLGLAKKVLIADSLARLADYGFSVIPSLSWASSVVAMLSYTLQIYFDFSGYCDMAIGIALMFNIKLPVNFNSPYKAVNIKEFWDRWHITLTRFFRNYVYIPLGGNRKGTGRTYVNVMIIFLLSGLWHGANWTFVLWGGLHGIALVFYRAFHKLIDKIPKVLTWCVTFLYINLCWIIFRADSIGESWQMIEKVFSFTPGKVDMIMLENFMSIPEFTLLGMVLGMIPNIVYVILLLLFLTMGCVWMKNTTDKVAIFQANARKSCVTIMLMIWCILSLSGVSAFLYFNF